MTFNPLIQRANPIQVTEVVVIDKSQQEAWLEAFGEVVRRFDGTWMGGSIEEGEIEP